MSVREYIGARYVPVFADPIQWDNTLSYEPLTVVMNLGTSYVSRQSVPAGIAIDNETYWVRWADYNAQLEEYIRQVQTYSASINALNVALPIADFDAETTVKDALDGLNALLPASAFDSVNTVDARFDTIEANSWVITDRIADANVTTSKIADANVTTEKLASTIQSKLKSEQLILIGDSWFNPAVTTRHLREYVAQKLSISTVYNEAYGGSGFFAVAGHTFIDQANAIIANTSIDKNRKTKIIVLGGTNDYSSTTNATLYINAINTIYDAFAAVFTDFEMQVFFMQGAVNRTYPYGLIKDVCAGVTKCKVNNAAWPVSFNKFVDNLHLDGAGEKEFSDYIASCFGVGDFKPRTVQIGIATQMNAINNIVSIGNVRFAWDENTCIVWTYMQFNASANAGAWNNYIDVDFPIPIRMTSAGISYSKAFTLGGAGGINIAIPSEFNRIGLRNHDALNASTYVGNILWAIN